jgi:non-ribosomal peptide synthase protein (TIGR01720 family)
VVVSSLASALGVVGHAAYTAAHCFMDAFVARHNATKTVPWICVNLDNWLTWKTETAPREGSWAMTADEGRAALRTILSLDGATQIFVSTGSLEDRIERWTVARPEAVTTQPETPSLAPRHTRPPLASEYRPANSDEERALVKIWEELLGIAPIGVDDNFFELGGDSVIGIQVVSRAAGAGMRLAARHLFEQPTIAGLAGLVRPEAPRRTTAQPRVSGSAPLTPIQHWFFEQDLPEARHFNQARLFEVRGVPADVVRRALSHVVEQHDELRARFELEGVSRRQVARDGEAAATFRVVDAAGIPLDGRTPLVAAAARDLHTGFDWAAGPMIGAVYVDSGPGEAAHLLLAAHHLIVDAGSWRIIVEDLQTACEQMMSGGPIRLPRKTTSYMDWSLGLEEYARSPQLLAESDYWLKQASASATTLPRDSRGSNTEGSTASIEDALTAAETELLLRRAPERGGSAAHALVTALAMSCLEWAGGSTLRLDLEGHGREDVVPDADLSRTVGWFTSLYPVAIEADCDAAPAAQLEAVSAQLRDVPNGGIGYGVLRYLNDGEIATRLRAAQSAEVSLLYLGRQDVAADPSAMFTPLPDTLGLSRSAQQPRRYLLEVTAYVATGRLRLHWKYSRELHEHATVQRVANRVVELLRMLLREARPSEPTDQHTAASFPGARLNQKQLQALLTSLKSGGAGPRR